MALALCLLLLPANPRAGEIRPGQAFDQEQVARVATAALAFMAPRILDAVPMPQLTIWGLRGLTTLDPRLTAYSQPGQLRLTLAAPEGERLLLTRPPPGEDDAAGWGLAAAALLRAGWDASQAVRRVGTAGVIRTFFDEVFNHLDPYSRYASPEEAEEEDAARSGRPSVGLGLVLRDGRFVVRAVDAGEAAALAGIRPGDEVLAIDGDDLDGIEPAAARERLSGPPNAWVVLDVRRGADRLRRIRLRLALAIPETVRARLVGSMLVLRISGFSGDTAKRLAREIERWVPAARRSAVRGVVLDLRGNRGGLLGQAASAAGTLLATGVVATTAGRDKQASRVFEADGPDLARDLPAVIVVDGRTASAAEILAAALADQRRAVVVGSATLGKGLVQTIAPLPDGGALYITWSRVLAPLGWPIQVLGVLPQVCTSMGQDATLRQLGELSHDYQSAWRALERHRSARPPLPPAEALEIRKACPAAEGRELDMVAARYLIEHPRAYATALLGPAPPPEAITATP